MDPTQARARILIDTADAEHTHRPPQKRHLGRFAPEHDPPANTATAPLRPRSAVASVIVGDRLQGAREIAMFLYGSDDAKAVRRLYHAVRRNRLPTGKDGGQLIASRAKLLAHWDTISTSKSDGIGPDADSTTDRRPPR